MVEQVWSKFPANYRQEEMETLAQWVAAGVSGSVVGLPGCGRSNLLGFLCHHPQALQSRLPSPANQAALVPVDLNNLPSADLSTLYRAILRAFYRVHTRFDESLQQEIARLYLENQREQDPFLCQGALEQVLLAFQRQPTPVVLVLNHFDLFCRTASQQMINILRGLRDSFKGTLRFIVGMCQEVAYLDDRERLGEMYELLDSYVCWVGTMNEADARFMIGDNTRAAPQPPGEAEVCAMLRLTGGFPSLLKVVCHWWSSASHKPPVSAWPGLLSAEHSLEFRLAKMWNGLTQEEQLALAQVLEFQDSGAQTQEARLLGARLVRQHYQSLCRLGDKGLCRQTERGWRVVGDLFTAYARRVGPNGRGKVQVDEKTQEIYQGLAPLRDLAPLEENLLRFLLRNPYTRHTKSSLIAHTWPAQDRQTIIDNDLQQLIAGLRKKIDLKPPRYVVTWKGNPEGGYQFYPEGRPE